MGLFDKLFGSEQKQEGPKKLASDYNMNAIALLMQGDADQAVAHLDKGLLLYPGDASLLDLRKLICKQHGIK